MHDVASPPHKSQQDHVLVGDGCGQAGQAGDDQDRDDAGGDVGGRV